MQFLGLGFQFSKAALSVNVHRILGDISNIEFLLELLWCPHQTLPYALQTHLADMSL